MLDSQLDDDGTLALQPDGRKLWGLRRHPATCTAWTRMRGDAISSPSRKFVPILSRIRRFPRQLIEFGTVGGLAARVNHITNIADDGGVPAVADLNWPQYNNFRSGDLSPADGLVAPDLEMLTPDACVNDCTDDLLNIWVQLGNTGAGPLLAGATVDVYGTPMGMPEVLLTSVDVPLALQPGEYADAIGIPVALTDLEQIRLVGTPKETECKVDMANEIVIVPPFCPSPG
mgnify:CR=1 FL=1